MRLQVAPHDEDAFSWGLATTTNSRSLRPTARPADPQHALVEQPRIYQVHVHVHAMPRLSCSVGFTRASVQSSTSKSKTSIVFGVMSSPLVAQNTCQAVAQATARLACHGPLLVTRAVQSDQPWSSSPAKGWPLDYGKSSSYLGSYVAVLAPGRAPCGDKTS
jgi:hypothetical protein